MMTWDGNPAIGVLAGMLLVAAAIRFLVAVDRFFTARRRARTRLPAVRRPGAPGAAQWPIDPEWALDVVAVAAQEYRRRLKP